MRDHWEVTHGKEPHQKTTAELAQDLSTRPDSLIHLTAKAEMARRAAVQDQWRSWIMFASVLIAALGGRRFGLLGLLRLSQFAA